MTPNKARHLLPEDIRPTLNAIPEKHWEEFAMVYTFHKDNMTVESRLREIDTGKGNSPTWITLWLEHSRFGAQEKNIRIIMLYVRAMVHKDHYEIKVDKIINTICDYYESL